MAKIDNKDTYTLLRRYGECRNIDTTLESIEYCLGNKWYPEADFCDMLERIKDKEVIRYYTEYAEDIEDFALEENPFSVFKVVQTDIMVKPPHWVTVDSSDGLMPLWLSFKRSDITGLFVGCYVGVIDAVFQKAIKRSAVLKKTDKKLAKKLEAEEQQKREEAAEAAAEANRKAQDDAKHQKQMEFLDTVYEALFYKEDWNNDSNKSNLRRYINALAKKIEIDIKNGVPDTYVFNKTRTKVVFNSRLMDSFGNLVHVMADANKEDGGTVLSNFTYTQGTRDLVLEDFEPFLLNLKPTEFFKVVDDIIFRGSILEFDLMDTRSLTHIIEERLERLPEHMREKSSLELARALKAAVEHAVTMARADYNYIVPMYNIKREKIQFLLPLYFNFGESLHPDNALVISKRDGFWKIYTILEMNEAYLNARLLGSPSVRWLDNVSSNNQ